MEQDNLGLEASQEILQLIDERDSEIEFAKQFKKNLCNLKKYDYTKKDLVAYITTLEVFLKFKNLEKEYENFKKQK